METIVNKLTKKFKKKGLVHGAVVWLVIVSVTISVVRGVVGRIPTGIQEAKGTYSLAHNRTGDGITGLDDLSGWKTTWMVILAAVVVLGLVAFFRTSSQERWNWTISRGLITLFYYYK